MKRGKNMYIRRRCISFVLVLTLLLSGNLGGVWEYHHPRAYAATKEEDIRLKGIDVSHHQGEIDWKAVKEDGIDFAIIRCGYGQDIPGQDDKYWKENADGCTKNNIPFGVYIYSYAKTPEKAVGEAKHVLRLIKGYTLQYPIYLDIEDASLSGLTASQHAANAKAFVETIEEAGYEAGIYSGYNWHTGYLTDPAFDQWDRWVARYNTYCGYNKDYNMWQYSSKGSVKGINGYVDMDYLIGTDVAAEVRKVSISANKVELKVGETYTLSGQVSPLNAFEKKVNWSSDKKAVATVNKDGKVTAVAKGTAKVTVSSVENPDIKASCTVNVLNVTETPKPDVTATPPVVSSGPAVTNVPEPSETPQLSASPEPSGTPQVSDSLEPSGTPQISATPKVTEKPQVSATPKVTEVPKVSATPKVTETPKVSATPKPTATPVVKPGKVGKLSYQAVSKNQIKLSWNGVKKADGYQIYSYNKTTKKDSLIASISAKENSYTVKKAEKKNLLPATQYTFKIAAYSLSGKTKCIGEKVAIKTITKPETVKITKVSRINYKKAKIAWKSLSEATGYVVYLAEKKNGPYKAVCTLEGKKKNTYSITKLKKGKVYYVRVCAYEKYNGKTWYGNFYKTEKIKK